MEEPRRRCAWNTALAFAIVVLVIPVQGCVTETKRRSALDPSARVVSVELRRPITGIGYNGVLFTPLDAAGDALLGWTPSNYDIARMEARLPSLLPGAGPKLFVGELPDLSEYRRQYSGHATSDRRIIQANYIHSSLIAERNLDWKHRRVPILNVGARYFQIWFDIEAEQVVHLLPES